MVIELFIIIFVRWEVTENNFKKFPAVVEKDSFKQHTPNLESICKIIY